MKILGLDFTSAPCPKKPITAAVCDLKDDLLRVNEIMKIDSFAAFESFLRLPGPWVAALDFPFGLPQKLLSNLGWPEAWEDYISLLSIMGKTQFEQTLIHYRESRPPGDKHHARTTDKYAGACSPMMLQRVPVGKMFFQGAPRLLAAGVSILPCHPTTDDRIVVEGYPALIVRKMIGKRGYKSDERNKQTPDKATARHDIVCGLRSPELSNQYGVTTIQLPNMLAEACIQDSTGDNLDALLSALQAAWSYTQRNNGYGIPSRSHRLEGWIVDPGPMMYGTIKKEPKLCKILAYVPEGEETFMPEQPKPLRGLVFANVAVLFFGLAGVLGKLSVLPAPLIVFGRVFFAGLVLLVICWFQHIPLRPKRSQDGFLLLGLGVLLALHWTTFFQAINVSNVAVGLLSFSSFPLFTAVLEPLLLHQRPRRVEIVAALLILLGIYLLVPSFTLQNQTTLGVMWGVLSAAAFALLSVANRWLGRTYPSLMISLYQDGIAAIVLLPVFFLTATGSFWTPHELLILLILGVVCTALAHTLFIASMRDITAQSASLLASLEPLWGIVFGVLLLGAIPTASTLLGGAIILSATLLPGSFTVISLSVKWRRSL